MLAPLGPTFRFPAGWTAFRRTSPPDGWAMALRRMLRIAKSRHDLASLDERLLRDIGVTRAEAEAEAARPPWDMQHRRS